MRYFFIFLFLTACTFNPASSAPIPDDLGLNVPPDAHVTVFAEVPNARAMTLAPNGTIYVGTRSEGVVYAIRDTNQDNIGDEVNTILSDLSLPVGVTYHEGFLYVSEVSRILRYDPQTKETIVITDDFPQDLHHGWKFIDIGPDNKLYVPIGAPCNNCEEGDPYAALLRMNLDGSEQEIIARGIRNTVGFAWHPQTRELWFTDNGRDNLGDDVPPDELNKLILNGHYGYPYCHGSIQDPEFTSRTCGEFIAPQVELGPHVAALGMMFYTSDMFFEYQNKILIAEHGSWNRKEPIGYRIMAVDPEEKTYSVFADGWLEQGKAWGRPVDVLEYIDGSILVSDDRAGRIYRIYR